MTVWEIFPKALDYPGAFLSVHQAGFEESWAFEQSYLFRSGLEGFLVTANGEVVFSRHQVAGMVVHRALCSCGYSIE